MELEGLEEVLEHNCGVGRKMFKYNGKSDFSSSVTSTPIASKADMMFVKKVSMIFSNQ